MDINWSNMDQLEDHFITYLLYKESKTVPQISKIRNISEIEVKDQLIKAKLEIKSMSKNKIESSKDILDKYLELDKSERLDFIEELGLDEDRMLKFKRELYKRIRLEKNAEDLIILIWTTGELKEEKYLDLLHSLTMHRHSDVRRITYSAIRKIQSPKSRSCLEKGLYDSNPQTRQYCAKALSVVGNNNSLQILKKLLLKSNHEKEYVLRAYEEAIIALEEERF
ncbi:MULTISPECIES: HEAT repeat domain-containing protein [Terrisporobacter]|uniref:HEAT repeat domain-containing protein n=2 Tax=Terrisporobacter TaxID=1505652 RepID=A0AAX2ZBB6_9FIRM|nr:HEAT repeat domain-containing protein [Terrisporobacter hibernicus]MBN9648437.1 HEAT repeat domain-containing protein [Terrisporobacter glycolicus]UEL46201.1 HEAT repeat domain-containing protein [Terrisporobacter hibernicus]UPA30186.1 HEAT repeat domain-containing protein [Terrisporobacter glycolicus]